MASPSRDDRPAQSEDSVDADAALLARHVAGDHDAFGQLVARHRDRLWAVALRTLGDREEAADALQDALVSAFRAAHTFQGRSAVTTWLHRIVVNACLDRARRSASRPTRPLDQEPAQEALLGLDEGADVSAERGELRRELGAALASLPSEQRAALVLVDMQGYPVAEAAAILGVPVGTVKSRCARGRARLLPQIAHLRAGAVSRETPPRAPGNASAGTAAGDIPPPGRGRNPNAGTSVPLLDGPRSDQHRAGGEQP
ncbi:RNA polymerase sigma factor SigM [Streptacidiphilus sp. N1-12]|uniref:RNA polymerase sigma factor SigM n=2 Tax=Streptacidiphilus alkalitolerans TaxID=3342712 RepID=A0ABV6V9Q3_9ACTN